MNNVPFIVLSSALVLGLTSCSKKQDNPRVNSPESKKAAVIDPVFSDSAQQQEKREEQVAVERAAARLQDDDLLQQIKGVRELRQTYSPEACTILINHLQVKEAQLPASLNKDTKLGYLLDYLGALVEEIRKMNQPKGNEAVEAFIKNFRMKYGSDKLGQAQLAIYYSQLKSVEQGVREGIYNKDQKPVLGLTN